MTKYLCNIDAPSSIITPIDSAVRFPEILESSYAKYKGDIEAFCELISTSESSANLLERIRSPKINKDSRMSMLKMFRRCVAPVLDTEMSKKISKVSTEELVNSYGATFKPIDKLRAQFESLDGFVATYT